MGFKDIVKLWKLVTGRTRLYYVITDKSKSTKFKVAYNSAGLDLTCGDQVTIPVGGSNIVPLGIRILPDELPFNFAIAPQIWARSGLSVRHGVEVGAGLGDNNYIGEYKAHIYNNGDSPIRFDKGDRICQMCFPVVLLPGRTMRETLDLVSTERGSRGFGSSGIG